MFSIFFGFSGAGGGGSSFFLGTTYGPTSFCGPPAEGGASCWFGFAGGCCGVSWAWVDKVAAIVQKRPNARRTTRRVIRWVTLLREVDDAGLCQLNTPENIGKSSKHLC